jgi:hypothetical protein
MRKFLAVIAVTLGVLGATATAAFASTPGPQPSHGNSCFRDLWCNCHEVTTWTVRTTWVWDHWRWVRVTVRVPHESLQCKPFFNPGGPRQGYPGGQGGNGQGGNGQGGNGQKCQPQTVTFTMPANSSVITEVSGPALHNGDEVVYQSQDYTVEDASGHTFSVEQNGTTVTNGATAITDGTAQTVCQ